MSNQNQSSNPRLKSSQMMDRISQTAALAYVNNNNIDDSADNLFVNPQNETKYGAIPDYSETPTQYGQLDIDNIGSANADNIDDESSEDQPKLPLSPAGMLALYTTINLLSYYDRGALSGTLDDINDAFPGISDTQKGLLGFVFMAGFMIASPIFAHAVSKFEPFRVMALGLFIWCCATLICGLASSYYILLLGRILTGFGEASFLCIAPPFIDKFAPAISRGLWLSVFYAAIPVGYACGFIASGIWLDVAAFGKSSWRAIFISEAIIMLPFVLFSLTGKSPYSFADDTASSSSTTHNSVNSEGDLMQHSSHGENIDDVLLHNSESKNDRNTFLHSMYVILLNPMFLFVVLGYAAQTFVTGGFAFYGIQYARNALDMTKTKAGIYFGAVTILTGIFGTLAGGILTDHLRKRRSIPSAVGYEGEEEFIKTTTEHLSIEQGLSTIAVNTEVGKAVEARKNDLTHPANIRDRLESVSVALTVVGTMTFIAIPLCIIAFSFDSVGIFFGTLTIAELLLFCCFSPLNNSVMWCVQFKYAPQAMAMSVVLVHLLGDSFSPLLIGYFLDHTDKDYHGVMTGASLVLILAVLSWTLGYIVIQRMNNEVKSYEFSSIFTAPNYTYWTGSTPTPVVNAQGVSSSLPEEFSVVRNRLRWDRDEITSSTKTL